MPIALAINGAAGRMGSRILALARGEADFRIIAAVDAPGSPRIGHDAGDVGGGGALGVRIADRCDANFDVMIDFSSPSGTNAAIETCVARRRPLVIGTTGLTADQFARIDAAARDIAILHSPNMSIGVNVMLRMAADLARTLGPDYDIEIVETHHRFKADAPSGTALALLETLQGARAESEAAVPPTPPVVFGRHGAAGARPAGQIGLHAVRLGDTIGEHVVHFGALGETLSLRHEAHTRDTFAAGALRAAGWIVRRPSGRYSMQDVLSSARP